MKAMILAAGFGLRLRPLTEFLPKSMTPLSNKPFLEHTINTLKREGIKEFVINLHHLPEKITDYFKDGSGFGVKINYSIEKEILGTAGGIKAAESWLENDLFFVVNSDIAFELDFKEVALFHKKNSALITMVLREEREVEKYGAIEIDSSGRVRRFLGHGKTPHSEELKKTMFTGIALYDPAVLKEFPDNGYCDISKEIYPKLMEKDFPVYGYVTDKYWADMGNPKNYLNLQKDVLAGKVFQGADCSQQEQSPGDRFSGVKIIPPVRIGENVTIEEGSVIGPYLSIGDNSVIQKGSKLNNSILWNNITIAENSTIENSIVYDNKRILV